jgi:hypothetical protein
MPQRKRKGYSTVLASVDSIETCSSSNRQRAFAQTRQVIVLLFDNNGERAGEGRPAPPRSVRLAMNASTSRWNSSGSSLPQHAVTDETAARSPTRNAGCAAPGTPPSSPTGST